MPRPSYSRLNYRWSPIKNAPTSWTTHLRVDSFQSVSKCSALELSTQETWLVVVMVTVAGRWCVKPPKEGTSFMGQSVGDPRRATSIKKTSSTPFLLASASCVIGSKWLCIKIKARDNRFFSARASLKQRFYLAVGEGDCIGSGNEVFLAIFRLSMRKCAHACACE